MSDEKGVIVTADQVMDLATAKVAGSLMDRLLTEIKAMPDPWQKMSEAKQRALLERLQSSVGDGVRQAVRLIAARGCDAVSAAVDQVVFKDGVKIVLKSVLKTEGAHALADHEGQSVVVVIADPEQYMGGIGDDRVDPYQPGLGGVL